jgi:streptogramin lyase
VEVYPPNSNGDVAPEASLTKGMYGPFVVVFDPSGDLWAANVGNSTLVELTKAQLSISGSPTPAVTISSTKAGAAGSLWGPYGVAVDPSGDVWVSNFNKPTAVEFGGDQLAKTGSPTPLRTVAGPHTGMNWPSFVVTEP